MRRQKLESRQRIYEKTGKTMVTGKIWQCMQERVKTSTVGAPLMSSPLMSFCALNNAPISKVVVRH